MRPDAKLTVTQTTLHTQHASMHQIWDPYLKQYRRYAPDKLILETMSVNVKVTPKRFDTRNTKMHPHTKFRIPTSNIIGDMLRIRLF